MKDIYITVTGTKYYYGSEHMKKGMTVCLIKDKDNEHDKEAIKVKMEGLGTIGYVGNSPYTVLGESYSAGRIYDRIGDEAKAKVLYVLPQGVLCKLRTKDVKVVEEAKEMKETKEMEEVKEPCTEQ